MKILVVAASKHGATTEIADLIGTTLSERGFDVRVSTPEQAQGVEDYDAFVLGSAVYAGHWLKSALDMVNEMGSLLAARPVWLFSSGPVGSPPKPDTDPVDVADIQTITGAQEHRLFAGKIDRSKLVFGEKAIVTALRVPDGDFRDWAEVRRWGEDIADALLQERVLTPEGRSEDPR